MDLATKEKERRYQRRYRKRNAKRLKAQKAAYYQENRAEFLEKAAKRRRRPETREGCRSWYRRNASRINAKRRSKVKASPELREKLRARGRAHYAKNKERRKAVAKRYYLKNRDRILERSRTPQGAQRARAWRKRNPDSVRASKRKHYNRNKPLHCLRSRLQQLLRGRRSSTETVRRHLGCSLAGLRFWLEKHFEPGMSWGNYGFRGWHVDHIKPLSKFNLNSPEELRLANHFTNLQPLWATDNIKKSNKV